MSLEKSMKEKDGRIKSVVKERDRIDHNLEAAVKENKLLAKKLKSVAAEYKKAQNEIPSQVNQAKILFLERYQALEDKCKEQQQSMSKRMEDETVPLYNEIQSLEYKLVNAESQIRNQGRDIEDISRRRDQLSIKLSASEQQSQDLNNQVISMQEEKKVLEENFIEKLAATKEPLLAKVSELENLLREQERNLGDQIDESQIPLKEEIVFLKNKIEEKDQTIQNHIRSVEELSQTRDQLTQELDVTGRKNRSLSEQLVSSQEKIKKVEESQDQKLAEVVRKTLELEIAHLEANLKETEASIQDQIIVAKVPLEQEIADLKTNLKETEASIQDQIIVAKVPLEQEIANLEANLKETEESVQDQIALAKVPLEQEIANLEANLKETEESVRDQIVVAKVPLEQEIAALQESLSETAIEVQDQKGIINEITRDRDRLDQELSVSKQKNNKLNNQLASKKEELNRVQKRFCSKIVNDERTVRNENKRIGDEIERNRRRCSDPNSRSQGSFRSRSANIERSVKSHRTRGSRTRASGEGY